MNTHLPGNRRKSTTHSFNALKFYYSRAKIGTGKVKPKLIKSHHNNGKGAQKEFDAPNKIGFPTIFANFGVVTELQRLAEILRLIVVSVVFAPFELLQFSKRREKWRKFKNAKKNSFLNSRQLTHKFPSKRKPPPDHRSPKEGVLAEKINGQIFRAKF